MAGRTKLPRFYLVMYTSLLKRGEYLWAETSLSATVERILLVVVCW